MWAAPAPLERDPETGEWRPPAEIGNAYGVVDRRTGELSVPAEEVVRIYQQKHGGGASGDAAAGDPAPHAPRRLHRLVALGGARSSTDCCL
ncbi:hypothetical protein [Streptomyces spiramyceticus]|uniref:hypothetical protein n=1 Tax=Streptomyces spiramyceticus TaxID=299717 RepID=UPI00237BB983|nr:hypothetical protein [Streptomyces spiramyceticus]